MHDGEEQPDAGLAKALGMYWRRSWVNWTQLAGSQSVDFAEQRGVYLLHDRREVVYVGRATKARLADRLKNHTRNRLNGRWDRFSWFGVLPVDEQGVQTIAEQLPTDAGSLIATMEAVLIEALEPPQNRQRGAGLQTAEFIQIEEPEIEEKRLNELMKAKLGLK